VDGFVVTIMAQQSMYNRDKGERGNSSDRFASRPDVCGKIYIFCD
jgi:hypothetical protein